MWFTHCESLKLASAGSQASKNARALFISASIANARKDFGEFRSTENSSVCNYFIYYFYLYWGCFFLTMDTHAFYDTFVLHLSTLMWWVWNILTETDGRLNSFFLSFEEFKARLFSIFIVFAGYEIQRGANRTTTAHHISFSTIQSSE